MKPEKPSYSSFGAALLVAVVLMGAALALYAKPNSSQKQSQEGYFLKRSVRRVILDVTVTDPDGKAISGLSQKDFLIKEDNKKQRILSFDVHDLNTASDFAKLPELPTNTFINAPAAPERGPLYVLLLDLVNTETDSQMWSRQQLIKFIHDKPEGTRFAIFVLADGLHLVQGFTSDKDQLFAAVDPNNPKQHIPRVFLYGRNHGAGSSLLMTHALTHIAQYLEGLPGRKNLMWFSQDFPIQLFPQQNDSAEMQNDLRKAIDSLVQAQVAVFPIENAGIVARLNRPKEPTARFKYANFHPGGARLLLVQGAPNSLSQGTPMNIPGSGDYMKLSSIADMTGGHAYFGRNDVAQVLTDATELGGNYYTLEYSPSNQNYDGKLRNIKVALSNSHHHYQLSYRQCYYADETDAAQRYVRKPMNKEANKKPVRSVDDSLFAYMQHGAPLAHEIYFRAHIQTSGESVMATAEQMEGLEDQPAYFRVRHKNRPLKPLAPIQLQTYVVEFTMMAQPKPGSSDARPPILEVASAAFNTDGQMLNGVVENTDSSVSQGSMSGVYRAQQRIAVPVNATSLRVAIRDTTTDHIGAMEIDLPIKTELPQRAGSN